VRADPDDERYAVEPTVGFGQEAADLASRLVINSLGIVPDDPSNRVDDDPKAASLGAKLFRDARLSATGAVSCASCHIPELGFQDGRPLGKGIGVANRRTMPLDGVAWNAWFFWDGRKDSLWSQALGPLENPVEHGANRVRLVRLLQEAYHEEYRQVFGAFPDLSGLPDDAGPLGDAATRRSWDGLTDAQRHAVNAVFANLGKAIAAFERQLLPRESRVDFYLRAAFGAMEGARDQLSEEEIEGLEIFAGKGRCISCHQGPRITDGFFHNTGVPPVPALPPDNGRLDAIALLEADPFNCLGPYSDAPAESCMELRFLQRDSKALLGAFKTPSLRGVSSRPPYMHAGQFSTLEEVVRHYDAAPKAEVGTSELKPLDLEEDEIRALVALLKAL
jgi:cytochrome c peroxidase